jgi:hypothetical protein
VAVAESCRFSRISEIGLAVELLSTEDADREV